ncbi:4Fe-4S dicluster domain-containing protein [Deinococcus hohokamensis]|uniref:Ferredoxin n=1 Tax=Deinococcus hohokamensis TaxID=309883 RepID=A0ABV9I718_9DEIO
MTYVITSACAGTKDGACAQICPVDCIRDGGETFLIDPDECICCGACVLACPVGAIFDEVDLPGTEQLWGDRARAFFAGDAP